MARTLDHVAAPTVDAVVRRLDDDGYAIVDGLLARDRALAIGAELRRLLDGVPKGRNPFEGYETRRLYAVFAKTRVLDGLAIHPLVLGAVEALLGPHCQLSGPTGIEIGPGQDEQVLHRDEDIYPVPRPHPQLVVNVMWAFDDFTTANGATRVFPGSHRDADPPAATATAVRAEMAAGSAMLYVGSLWHGGGANRTDRSRLGVAIEYCAGWLRPQETHLLVVTPELARALPKRLRELLGYSIYPPFVGYVDGRHPERVVEAVAAEEPPAGSGASAAG